MSRALGYCCINLTLGEHGITTTRGMIKNTFIKRGIGYASELALKNTRDLIAIINWNHEHGIRMYRMSSDLFPWCSEYEISQLPHFPEIVTNLKKAGALAKQYSQRLTFHPSPYGVIASKHPTVMSNAIKEINQHAEIMDLMDLDKTPYYPINVHVNTTQPNRLAAADRFCRAFDLLSYSAKPRLVIENDDKPAAFTPEDLYENVYKKIGIPITFDFFHYACNFRESTREQESLHLSLETWEGITPITHYSDSKKLFEDEASRLNAHSDWIWIDEVPNYGYNFDIEFEAKMKEKALLKYMEKNQDHG